MNVWSFPCVAHGTWYITFRVCMFTAISAEDQSTVHTAPHNSVPSRLVFDSRSQSQPYRSADKSLARPGRKQATTEDFNFHISYLQS
jgi:hypothetical protein